MVVRIPPALKLETKKRLPGAQNERFSGELADGMPQKVEPLTQTRAGFFVEEIAALVCVLAIV